MQMAIRAIIVLTVALLAALPARAATTVFGDSVFSETGVLDSGNVVGNPNGSAATIQNAGELVLRFFYPLTGENVSLAVLPTVGFNVIALSIGEIIGGVATFSGDFLVVDTGVGGVLSANLTSLCNSVSASGCTLLKIRNAGALLGSSGLLLDGVSGVSNAPEPAIWAMMMLGFAGVAWRLKADRRRLLSPSRKIPLAHAIA